MKANHLLATTLLFAPTLSFAGGQAGRFDYWVLSLSWSPQYCASAQKPDARQCGTARPYGFVVHGLWPQYERGYPADCQHAAYVDEALIQRLLPIMPSKPLILHEWRKHGTCSGLDAKGYFGKLESSYQRVKIPPRYTQLSAALNLPPKQLEADFLKANPGWSADGLALQCSGRYLSELRLCFDKSLQPRDCGVDVRDRCGAQLTLRPLRGG